VDVQAAAFAEDQRCCTHRGSRPWSKGKTSFMFRPPFGDLQVRVQRIASAVRLDWHLQFKSIATIRRFGSHQRRQTRPLWNEQG